LAGKRVTREFWITTSRPVKGMADRMGYTAIIEAAGAKFATDTCCVVAPIKGRFTRWRRFGQSLLLCRCPQRLQNPPVEL
jgi:predicted aconitase